MSGPKLSSAHQKAFAPKVEAPVEPTRSAGPTVSAAWTKLTAPKPAEGAVVACFKENDLLKITRGTYLSERIGGDYAGIWQSPGGKIDAGERPGDAALRELKQETGLELVSTDLSFQGSKTYTRPSGATYTVYLFFAYLKPNQIPRVPEKEKGKMGEWQYIAASAIPQMKVMPTVTWTMEIFTREPPEVVLPWEGEAVKLHVKGLPTEDDVAARLRETD